MGLRPTRANQTNVEEFEREVSEGEIALRSGHFHALGHLCLWPLSEPYLELDLGLGRVLWLIYWGTWGIWTGLDWALSCPDQTEARSSPGSSASIRTYSFNPGFSFNRSSGDMWLNDVTILPKSRLLLFWWRCRRSVYVQTLFQSASLSCSHVLPGTNGLAQAELFASSLDKCVSVEQDRRSGPLVLHMSKWANHLKFKKSNFKLPFGVQGADSAERNK